MSALSTVGMASCSTGLHQNLDHKDCMYLRITGELFDNLQYGILCLRMHKDASPSYEQACVTAMTNITKKKKKSTFSEKKSENEGVCVCSWVCHFNLYMCRYD